MIQHWQDQHTCYLRLTGDVRLTQSAALESLIREILDDVSIEHMVVDLSEAHLIDSTSLGMMARLAIAARDNRGYRPLVVSTNPDITRIVRTTGLEALMDLTEDRLCLPGHTASRTGSQRSDGDAVRDEEKIRRQVIDAHETLMDLSEDNRVAFAPLVEQLKKQPPSK
jgi:anti-anti-sigma factor